MRWRDIRKLLAALIELAAIIAVMILTVRACDMLLREGWR